MVVNSLIYLYVHRVQIGLQHTNNEILKIINRECTNEDGIKAIKRLKENGFKVDIHLMPDLPGSSPTEDIKMFNYVLDSPDMQADYWKIYPCQVTPFTEIEKWYKAGTYKPYSENNGGRDLIDVIKYVKTRMHPDIRLNRIIRDIPNITEKCPVGIIGGNMITNLRQIILKEMENEGSVCRCIRCREVKNQLFDWRTAAVFVVSRKGSGGIEHFISIEHSQKDILYGFLRLRYNDSSYEGKRISDLDDCALIRELHVYGSLMAVKREDNPELNPEQASQHFGIGKKLMSVAEEMAKRDGWNRIAVISGVGVRGYYRKLGYEIQPPYNYMIKCLTCDTDNPNKSVEGNIDVQNSNVQLKPTMELSNVHNTTRDIPLIIYIFVLFCIKMYFFS